MDLTTLDLDTPSTYAGIFHKILYAEDVWPVLDSYFKDGHGKIEELFANPDNIKDPFLKKLQHNCEDLLRKKYDYVTAYHACRTNDPEQYCRFGLLIASQERLEAKAREIFTGIGGLEKAISEAKSYLDAYGGSVHMYISAEFADIDYLDKGSFYLRKVGANLGGEGRLERQGKSFFVKCRIPLSWLSGSSPFGEHKFLYLYVAALMRRCIWVKAYPDEKYRDWPQPLAVFKAIPPENVLAVLGAEVCISWRERHKA
ncbi:MAG: hypothetical protein WC404_02830 [Candidatus Omnitrophota bacterium]|jgi:hypothetical protein